MAAAPAGYRTFSAGEVLTAANVQTFLQDQVIAVFANATARDAAITSPADNPYIGIICKSTPTLPKSICICLFF